MSFTAAASILIPALTTLAGKAIEGYSENKKAEKTAAASNVFSSIPQYNFGSAALSDENLKDSKQVSDDDNSSSNKFAKSYDFGSAAVSDERLKRLQRLFGDDGALDAFSKIDAYVYNYNDKAKQLYDRNNGSVDDNTHFGPMAQDLARNPVTEGTVHKDDNGYLEVDTRQLTLTNTAIISQLARKVQELEEKVGGR